MKSDKDDDFADFDSDDFNDQAANVSSFEDKNVFFVAPEPIPDTSSDAITTASDVEPEQGTVKTDDDLSNEIKK